MLSKLPTIEEAARLMRQKELTPLDLVEHCLGRIAQFEDRIHAWVLVDEEGARKEAREVGTWIGKDDARPLLGIPIGIKDIIDVRGMPTKCGSRVREDATHAALDSEIVAALRDEGAIILGKTVTTDYASFDPPVTRNPWDFAHTPGGSSSGSAAAVATEMCMAAIGTQTGGSIIRPAAY
ncbi:MAG: amidase family protein, partial [Gammaproteobacteria bacterium]